MTPQQFVGMAVRLFALWLVFSGIQMVATGINANNQPGLEATSAYFIWAAVIFLLALGLWFFPMVVAHKLVPRTKFENVLRVPASQATAVACVILGLWLFVEHVVPALAYYSSLAITLRANNISLATSAEFAIARLGAVAIEFAVAAILCFGARTRRFQRTP